MVFFFYGANSYASREQLHKMIEAYVKKTGSDLGLERIDGAVVDYKQLLADVMAVPFLASSRLVVVEYLSVNKATSDKIEELVKAVPATTVVVFYEKEVDKRSRYFKTLSSDARVVEFKSLTPDRLSPWVRSKVKQLGATIDGQAVQELVSRCGDDQWRLEQELIKLSNYNLEITKEAVVDLVEERVEESIFDLVEAMTQGRTAQALERYRRLLASGANEIYVLTMIMWQLRNLLLAKTAGTISPQQLSRDASMSPYVASKVLNEQRRFSEEQLKRAFLAGVETETKIKTGEGKPDQLVELLVYKVASEVS